MIKIANKGGVQMAKKGRPRMPGGIKELGSPKPPKNPSLISQHSKQRKPVTLAKTGIKRDV